LVLGIGAWLLTYLADYHLPAAITTGASAFAGAVLFLHKIIEP
jgi:hypothetical protein